MDKNGRSAASDFQLQAKIVKIPHCELFDVIKDASCSSCDCSSLSEHCSFYKTGLHSPVSQIAFSPNNPENDQLSK